jgi:hypothetical protein
MPRSRYYGRNRRRVWRRRNARKRKAITRKARRFRSMPPLGMPSRKLVRLKYVDTISIDPPAAGVLAHYFSANGMFDPNITGTGHQPLYFDQWMAGYDHFTVIGSKIRVTPSNPTTADIVPCQYGCIIDDNTTFSYTTSAQVIESSQGRFSKIAGAKTAPQTKYSSSIVRKWSGKKFFGTKSLIGEDTFRGSAATNPVEEAYFGVWAGSIGDQNGGKLYLTIEIEYIAMLTEPKFVAQS